MVCAVLYFSTAIGVSKDSGDRRNAWHHYEYLVDGFLSGQLSLSVAPPPGLLALPDPYDPAKNADYRLWDATLYHGKYYLYFGPTPAVLLMLPWKMVTGHHLPQWAAAAIFAIGGLAALALLLGAVRQTYFPAASPTQLFFAVLLAGHISWLPVLLRRPAVWELPIVAAAALFWWSLYFLWRDHQGAGRARWALAGGVALAFIPGARPTYTFAVAFMALLFALSLRASGPRPGRWRRLASVFIPLAIGGAVLAAYNYLRFGAVFEFGQSYQLWGVDFRGLALFSPRNATVNGPLYFLTPPNLSSYFPFLRAVSGEGTPSGYLGSQDMVGVLFVMPALLIGAATWWYFFQHRRDAAQGPLHGVLVAATIGGALVGGFLFCFGGGCSRYITELLAGWTLVTAIGVFVVFAGDGGNRKAGVVRLLSAGAIAWTIVGVNLASFEFRGIARTTQPRLYHVLAHALNYSSYWAARYSGQSFGPVALEVRLAQDRAAGATVLFAAGQPSTLNQLVLERIERDRVRLRLLVNESIIVETPALRIDGPTLHVRCDAPWLYPPADHPYWDIFSAEERQRRQTLFSITVDDVVHARRTTLGFDAIQFDPVVRTGPDSTSCAWVEKWTWLDSPAAH